MTTFITFPSQARTIRLGKNLEVKIFENKN